MKWLETFLVGFVVGVAVVSTDDLTPTPVASLIMQRQGSVITQEENSDVTETTTTTTTTQAPPQVPKPKMYRMHVESHIEYRFANTLISSRVGNPANVSQEVYFSVTLPETAFISKFLMEVDGKVYEASVKEKEEAKKVYDQAVASGQGAAHVAVSARDSNRFTVSVNIEPTKKVNFNLTYEELLIRRLGAYNHVINLDPGQVVADLKVDVYIKESKDITVLRVPELRSGNEVDADETTAANPLAKIERKSPKEAHITFSPTEAEQKSLGRVKGLDVNAFGQTKAIEGLGGQFVVQYDVDRDDKAGEVLVNNGYFVHFFAPKDLAPLRKHALFVLDVSGSMEGRKIEQLKEAMNAILDDLNEGDYFNIIEFSYSVTVWNLDATASSAVFSPYSSFSYDDAPKANMAPTPAFPATPEYIAKAKEIVTKMRAGGGTNIYDTLKTVIRVAHEGLQNVTEEKTGEKRNPLIVFLTDGEPTVGETRLNKIFSVVQELNNDPEAAIFSLAFGDDADLDFLKKLSLKNSGFARKIYEASDAALQLRDFYRQIASPLLANVTFNYQPDKIDENSTTRTHFHTLFSGSEIIVAGRIKPSTDEKPTDEAIEGQISGFSHTGDSVYSIARPDPAPGILLEGGAPVTSLERLWAYLTIQQLLEKQDTKSSEDEEVKVEETTSASNETKVETVARSPKKEALRLALQYSFVTPLTSLVVVKPNATKETGTINPAGSDANSGYGAFAVDRVGTSGYPLPLAGGPAYLNQRPQYASSFASAGAPSPPFIQGGQSGGGFSGAGFAGSANKHTQVMGIHTLSINEKQEESSYESDVDDYSPSAPQAPPGPPGRPQYDPPPRTTTTRRPPQTTNTPPTTDTSITVTEQVPVLISLEELEWLDDVFHNNCTDVITLPFDNLEGNKTYHLERNNQTHVDLQDCKTPSGAEGQCRHLSQCSLSSFKHDVQSYKDYFCQINNFAGACCPKSLFPEETTAHIHVDSTTVSTETSE